MKIYVDDLSKLPQGEHWVILKQSSVTIPGDARSLAHPGHGYPESTKHYLIHVAFTVKAEFEAALIAEFDAAVKYGDHQPSGIHVCGVYTAQTSLSLKENK